MMIVLGSAFLKIIRVEQDPKTVFPIEEKVLWYIALCNMVAGSGQAG